MKDTQIAEMTLRLEKVKNNAVSDGRDINTVGLYIESKDAPVANIRVVFEVDGAAIFVTSRAGVYATSSNQDGFVEVSFTSTKIEHVELSCFIVEDKQNVVFTGFDFIKIRDIFKIDRVQSRNQTLYYGEPNFIWEGASILLHTSGGSGEVEWSVGDEKKNNISLVSDDYGSAEATAISYFTGSCEVIAKDKVTGETSNHIFYVHNYLYPTKNKIGLQEVIQDKDKRLLSKSALKTIYDQWGDLSVYSEWLPNTPYWTSQYNLIANKVTVMNSSTGIFVEEPFINYGEIIMQGLVYRKSEDDE
ncbi:Ig-like domain-containing protein [Erwinia tasmaniensis]|uniref:Ig-like domain-containing protein n=1 Tax=Erwinia tasmaniensis TaxID=338565 RepID=UPI003A4D6421